MIQEKTSIFNIFSHIQRIAFYVLVLIALIPIVFLSASLLKKKIEARVLHSQLAQAGENYSILFEKYRETLDTYNRAIRKTAITDIAIEDNTLSVVLMGLSGELERFETQLDPSQEIFFDYIIIDGRLMPRRIFHPFNANHAIDLSDKIPEIDWGNPDTQGIAIYRAFQGDGRWRVTTNGTGGLHLAPIDNNTSHEALFPSAHIEKFAPENLPEAGTHDWRQTITDILTRDNAQ